MEERPSGTCDQLRIYTQPSLNPFWRSLLFLSPNPSFRNDTGTVVDVATRLKTPERTTRSVRHHVVATLVVLAIIAMGTALLVYNQGMLFDHTGGLSIKKIDDPSGSAIHVDPALVQKEAPALARAMDDAIETVYSGVTNDRDVTEALAFLREHVDEHAGSWDVEYKGAILRIYQESQ